MQGENRNHIRELNNELRSYFGKRVLEVGFVESPALLDVEDLIGQRPQDDWMWRFPESGFPTPEKGHHPVSGDTRRRITGQTDWREPMVVTSKHGGKLEDLYAAP